MADTSGVSQWENLLLDLINRARAEAGRDPLAFDAELVSSAGRHSDWMVANDVFSHTGAGGSSPAARMTADGYGWRAAGENIACIAGGSAATLDAADVERLHTMLMNSSGHRANILNGTFTEIGLGITQGDYRGMPAIFVTENFGRPTASEAAEPDSWFI
ncbi:CAP domain-containing protein [Falsiroseomonas oryzae]|uniref:CAP domain-containing protein n=1 Tax=Falsiroseomonas oryzae TaxID=2766473 RepID=UPI0022EB1629|nr:CAP domain-containing protein [Roseomonas sp. MO-31]